MPRNFDDFLKNGDNKNRLLEICKQVFQSRSNEIQQNLKCHELYYSLDGICYKFTDEGISVDETLSSNQEEADTKVIRHAIHALNSKQYGDVIIRSNSGDTDINVLALSIFINDCESLD